MTLTRFNKKNLYISYNPYTDVLQLMDKTISQLPEESFSEQNKTGLKLIYYKNRPLLVEVKNAYERTGISIESLDREGILKIIDQMVKKI
jgi:hypothetical protein